MSTVRNIKIKSVGGSIKTLTVDESVSTWSQLKQSLNDIQVPTQNMKAIIGGSNVTLEIDSATIPNEDFILFLLPVQVKSGAYDASFLNNVQKQINSKKSNAFCAHKLDITVMEFIKAKEFLKTRITPVETTVSQGMSKEEAISLLTAFYNNIDNIVAVAGDDELINLIGVKLGFIEVPAETEEQYQERLLNEKLTEQASLLEAELKNKGLLVKDEDKA